MYFIKPVIGRNFRSEYMKYAVNGSGYGGGSLQGYIDVSYAELTAKLGKPSDNYDDYKSDAEWQIKFEDGTTACIYNYKDGKNYSGDEGTPTEDITDWHIGGANKRSVELVTALFGKFEKVDTL